MGENKAKYGLFTAIAMLVGVVIGSGIFFKSDNVLVGTHGNVLLGVGAFFIAAFSIIFGGLSMSQLAARTDRPGGAIAYVEVFAGPKLGRSFGWFQNFVYYPGLIVVVSGAVGVYIRILFNLQGGFTQEMLLGLGFTTLCFLFNTWSPGFGGFFQNATMIIKLIPLLLIAICGLIFGDPGASLSQISLGDLGGASLFAAIGPVIFAYDGWIVATSIAHEIKNAKRNLPIALIFAPIFVTITYVLYFLGITSYLGTDQVIQLGDAHVYLAANQLLGGLGAKLLLIFVIISVMGTVNGLILGYIRIPYSLALSQSIPLSPWLAVENSNLHMPVHSAIFGFILCLIWNLIHYLTTVYGLLPNSDISEISIALGYSFYILMYIQVFRLWRQGKITSWFKGLFCPLAASLGSCFILYSCMQSPLFIYYALFCLAVAVTGAFYKPVA